MATGTCNQIRSRAAHLQIHDQGAGGNCNVVKEIIYPAGAEINIRAIKLGDATMSALEIWGAEYQENDCLLIKPDDQAQLQAVCDRERTFMQVLGRTRLQAASGMMTNYKQTRNIVSSAVSDVKSAALR